MSARQIDPAQGIGYYGVGVEVVDSGGPRIFAQMFSNACGCGGYDTVFVCKSGHNLR